MMERGSEDVQTRYARTPADRYLVFGADGGVGVPCPGLGRRAGPPGAVTGPPPAAGRSGEETMGYRYATERRDSADLATGHVLRSAPGHPGFPVRLASELLQRALTHVEREPAGLWDPCCGSGYLATVLGLLHRDRLAHVLASDPDPDAVGIATGNLDLLTEDGLAERARTLRASGAELGKASLSDRADTAERLADRLRALGGDLPHAVHRADAFAPLPVERDVDIVLTDVPYGDLTHWSGRHPGGDPIPALLGSLAAVLPGRAVLVVAARARKVALPEGIRALERLRVGNRAAVLVRASQLQ